MSFLLKIVIEVLMFAVVIMILYSWGIIKQQRQSRDLYKLLNIKAEKRIVKELKRKGIMSKQEIEKEILGLKASQFGCRQKLIVKDAKVFSKDVLNKLLDKNVIEIKICDNSKKYVLKNKSLSYN